MILKSDRWEIFYVNICLHISILFGVIGCQLLKGLSKLVSINSYFFCSHLKIHILKLSKSKTWQVHIRSKCMLIITYFLSGRQPSWFLQKPGSSTIMGGIKWYHYQLLFAWKQLNLIIKQNPTHETQSYILHSPMLGKEKYDL